MRDLNIDMHDMHHKYIQPCFVHIDIDCSELVPEFVNGWGTPVLLKNVFNT